jgi:hypothetical protein
VSADPVVAADPVGAADPVVALFTESVREDAVVESVKPDVPELSDILELFVYASLSTLAIFLNSILYDNIKNGIQTKLYRNSI